MTPDQIRRSWDDDDTPRSVFPEPLAERLTRENKELRARSYALMADLSGLVDEWVNGPRPALEGNVPIGETFAKSLRAVLDKHAGEQP